LVHWQRLAVTVAAQVPVVRPGLLHTAPPLQSALVEQEHRPELHCDVGLTPGQLASVVQATPETRQVPVEVWHASPLQSALVAQTRPATGYVAEQSDAAVVQPPLTQLPLRQSLFEPHCPPAMLLVR
jgi:hypothetical protein